MGAATNLVRKQGGSSLCECAELSQQLEGSAQLLHTTRLLPPRSSDEGCGPQLPSGQPADAPLLITLGPPARDRSSQCQQSPQRDAQCDDLAPLFLPPSDPPCPAFQSALPPFSVPFKCPLFVSPFPSVHQPARIFHFLPPPPTPIRPPTHPPLQCLAALSDSCCHSTYDLPAMTLLFH